MIKNIWHSRWLQPPQFADAEQTRVGSMLHIILLTNIVFNLLNSIAILVTIPESNEGLSASLFILVLQIGLLIVNRRGYVRSASLIYCVTGWLLITFVVYSSGGLFNFNMLSYTIFIVIAAALLGTPGVLAFGLMSIASSAGLLILHQNHILPQPLSEPPAPRIFINYSIVWASLSFILVVLTRSMRAAIDQIQKEIQERRKVQKHQERLVTVLDAMPDFVGMINREYETTYVNRAGQRMVGLPENAPPMPVKNYHPEWVYNLILEEALPTALETGIWSGETALLKQDGTEIPASQVIFIHKDESGNVQHLSTILHDLSESKRVEAERLEIALQSERVDTARELISHISHDLRNPLTVINTSLYLLEKLSDPERQQEKISNIKEQVSLLEKLIQDILTLSRLDQLPTIERQPVDIVHLLENMRQQVAAAAEAKQIDIEINISPDIAVVTADLTELYRALINLVENAVNYTDIKGIVTLRAYPRDKGAAIEIQDTGIGIGEEELPHIFERYYRADAARKRRSNGSGLGLAIVKRIIEMHGGNIVVESTSGKGSTFRIWLPEADTPIPVH